MKTLSPRQKEIYKLWMKGHSGLRIAQMLGTSRSAVLGMLKRLRDWGYDTTREITLPVAKQKSAKPKPPADRKPVERKAPANLVRLQPPKNPSPPPPPVVVEPKKVEKPLGIKFVDLRPHHCRYVLNNGHASTFLFCGKPKWKSSFCEEHYKLVYVPSIPKKR